MTPKKAKPAGYKRARNLLARRLDAVDMRQIMLAYHKKNIAPLKSKAEQTEAVKKMNEFAQKLLKRRFRDNPAQEYFFDVMRKKPTGKGDTMKLYSKLMVNYFITKGKSKEQAKQDAIKTLKLMHKKTIQLNRTNTKSANYFIKKISKGILPAEEHAFDTQFLQTRAYIDKIKEMP